MASLNVKDITLSVVFDNITYKEGFKGSWGFSLVVSIPNTTFLFDTGGNGGILLRNMEQIGIDPKIVGIVILSHNHHDHTGGLQGFLEYNPDVALYLPGSFPKGFKDVSRDYGADVFEVKGPFEITGGVTTTGEMGDTIVEQSLIIVTDSGLIVITGCAHPGIVEVVSMAKEIAAGDVLLLIGGFHLFDKGVDEVRGIINRLKDIGVKNVAPCHCTGDGAIRMFKEAYVDNFIRIGAGSVIEMTDLR